MNRRAIGTAAEEKPPAILKHSAMKLLSAIITVPMEK